MAWPDKATSQPFSRETGVKRRERGGEREMGREGARKKGREWGGEEGGEKEREGGRERWGEKERERSRRNHEMPPAGEHGDMQREREIPGATDHD